MGMSSPTIWTVYEGVCRSRVQQYHLSILKHEVQFGIEDTNFVREVVVPAGKLPHQNFTYMVDSLNADSGYVFRIAATNHVGRGEYSKPSNVYKTLEGVHPGVIEKVSIASFFI